MKTETEQKLNYAIYGRKSTESEDRQVLSLDSQMDKAKEIADRIGVRVSDKNILTESKSAKITNNRPLFAEMVRRIEKGELNAVIVWHADRLSRNAIDSAILIDLMDRNKLVEIVTPGQTFRNTPFDKFMFMLQCTQAKMENDKKGIDVKRGMEKKAKMGIFPGPARVGYINDKFSDKGNKKIVSDPERLPIIRKMFDLILTGRYSPLAIRDIVNNEWGFRMPDGNKLSRSYLYTIFRETYYYGMFEYPRNSGNWYEGTHEKIITEEEYDKVQIVLGRKGRPRPKNHIFNFVGMMRCGECGGAVTAETKEKRQLNGNIHTYIYYHCTKRVHPDCTQGSLEEKKLKNKIITEIEQLEIPPEFHSFAMKWWKKEDEKEVTSRNAIVNTHQKAYKACLARIDGITNMRASGEIGPEEFAERRTPMLAEKRRLEGLFVSTAERIDAWINTGDEMFKFIQEAKDKFNNGTLNDRRAILSAIGSNLLIKDKELIIDTEKCLFPIKKIAGTVRGIKKRLEPLNTIDKQRQFEQMCEENPLVCAIEDSNL